MPKGEGKLIAQNRKARHVLFYKEQKSNLFEMVVSI